MPAAREHAELHQPQPQHGAHHEVRDIVVEVRQLDRERETIRARLGADAHDRARALHALDAHLDAWAARLREAQIAGPNVYVGLPTRVDRVGRDRLRASAQEHASPAHFGRQHVRVAEEVEDEGRRGVLVELVGGADLLDAAAVHHDHVVGEFERFLLIVRHEHARDVELVVQLAQPAPQVLAHARVERAERLVEQQHARPHRERARERDALALPT